MAKTYDRRTVLGGLATGGTLAVAGCLDELDPGGGNGGDETDEERDPAGVDEGYEVQIGIIGAVSGDLGPLGPPIRDAALLPTQQLEDEGAPIEFDVQEEDTATDTEQGISAADALINAGYPMVNGALASEVTNEIAPRFADNEIPSCSPASTDPTLTDLDDDDYFFRTAPSDALQGQVLSDLAREEFDAETTSALHLNDEYGQGLADTYVDAFEEDGGEVLEQVSFEPEQPSYISQLESALSDEPDTLMVVAFPESGNNLFRDYYSDFDTGIDILVTDGLADETLPGEVGNDMENVTATGPGAAGPNVDAFTDLYEDAYDSSPGAFNSHAYDATAVLVLANVAAGENDGAAVRDYVRSVAAGEGDTFGPGELTEAVETLADGDPVVYEGASSTVEFDENGDVTSSAFDVMEFRDGELEVVDTREFGD